jgi:hypothetical protein
LNSRLSSIQAASAALIHILLRNGYESVQHRSAQSTAKAAFIDQKLGRAGSLTGVCLARLLGQGRSLASSPLFDRGLSALDQRRCTTDFDKAVQVH